MRYAAVDGVLTVGRNLPGRGVYTCPSAPCFEEARARRAFGRSLRAPVIVEPQDLYTDESHG